MSEFEDKWIDAEIINPPYNDIINVCYYSRYIILMVVESMRIVTKLLKIA